MPTDPASVFIQTTVKADQHSTESPRYGVRIRYDEDFSMDGFTDVAELEAEVRAGLENFTLSAYCLAVVRECPCCLSVTEVDWLCGIVTTSTSLVDSIVWESELSTYLPEGKEWEDSDYLLTTGRDMIEGVKA